MNLVQFHLQFIFSPQTANYLSCLWALTLHLWLQATWPLSSWTTPHCHVQLPCCHLTCIILTDIKQWLVWPWMQEQKLHGWIRRLLKVYFFKLRKLLIKQRHTSPVCQTWSKENKSHDGSWKVIMWLKIRVRRPARGHLLTPASERWSQTGAASPPASSPRRATVSTQD